MVKRVLNTLFCHKDAKNIRSLSTSLPKMSAYRKDFDKTKCMSFLIRDEKLLEKYNESWKKSLQHQKKYLTVNLYMMEIPKN